MRNRKLTLSLLFVLLLSSLALVAYAMQPSPTELLTQAIETTKAVTDGHAIVEFNVTTPQMSASGAMEIWGKLDVGPNGEPAFRAEVLASDSPEMVGATAVSDGAQFWLWQPAQNKVLTGTADELAAFLAEQMAEQSFDHNFERDYSDKTAEMPATPEEAVTKLLEYFTAERNGSAAIAGVNATGLRLIPIPEQMPEEIRAAGGYLQLYLRPDDSAPLSLAYVGGAMGSGTITATLLELNQGIDNGRFTFTIPDGAEVIRLADLQPEQLTAEQADALAFTATDLPADARFLGATEVRGAIVQSYARSDGGFSVAQGPATAVPARDANAEPITVRGVAGTLYQNEDGSQSLLTWSEGDTTFWIGGSLTPAEALAIAESLK
jgi:outer membrane lipoprotein-sorting protein